MNDEHLQRLHQIYGVENWSAGYFDINPQGHVIAHPAAGDVRFVNLKSLVDDLVRDRKVQLPLVLRFPQILSSQLRKLSLAYHHAMHQFQYTGQHWPVFPMKVNPRREVVETFLKDSDRLRVGL